jgi:hypothetical protein
MKAHDWFVEHRDAMAARLLDPDEERLFQAHLQHCVECREAVAAIDRDLGWLPMGIDPVTPRPGFTQGVVSDITSRRGFASRVRRQGLVAALFLLAIGGTWWFSRGRVRELERDLAAARDTLSVLRAERILQASIVMNGRQGGMLIFADETSHRWKIVVHGIPAAPSGERYTFWFITGDGMVRGAEVICDETNPAVLTLDMPPGARLIKGGALTMEPVEGPLEVPRGKELAHLEL